MAGRTIVTPENEPTADAYIDSKFLLDTAEEQRRADRARETPRQVVKLTKLKIQEIYPIFEFLYRRFAPGPALGEMTERLRGWANRPGPSEVRPTPPSPPPLVQTEDRSFPSFAHLFQAIAADLIAESSKQLHEAVAFDVLKNLATYTPVLEAMLGNIEERLRTLPANLRARIVREGYAKFLVPEASAATKSLTDLILKEETESLRRLFLAVNTIHSFAVQTKQLAPQRALLSRLSRRTDKYSPFGPEIEKARERGYAVWSGLSGSTADILNLAQTFGLSSDHIQSLAALTAAFFFFLPTSQNPTHTLHEVMFVAHTYFNVPYDPKNPIGTLPHVLARQLPNAAPPSRVVRFIGAVTAPMQMVSIDDLVMLHNVPRKGVPHGNIDSLVRSIEAKGYDLSWPVSATQLPNGTLLVTGGHHRVAAMKFLGQSLVPVRIYSGETTSGVFLAKMVGIARITGTFHSMWLPRLPDLELVEVNLYLAEWMRQNDDQVKRVFLYPLRSRAFPPTAGLYPQLEAAMTKRAAL